MWKTDLKWLNSEYSYFEDCIPKLKENAPDWVVDSYNHYMEQLKRRYGDNKNEYSEYTEELLDEKLDEYFEAFQEPFVLQTDRFDEEIIKEIETCIRTNTKQVRVKSDHGSYIVEPKWYKEEEKKLLDDYFSKPEDYYPEDYYLDLYIEENASTSYKTILRRSREIREENRKKGIIID